MVCIGLSVTAWLTSRSERRILLTVTLTVLALTNFASAFAPARHLTTLLLGRHLSADRACGDPDEAKEGLGRVAAGRLCALWHSKRLAMAAKA